MYLEHNIKQTNKQNTLATQYTAEYRLLILLVEWLTLQAGCLASLRDREHSINGAAFHSLLVAFRNAKTCLLFLFFSLMLVLFLGTMLRKFKLCVS